VGVTERLALTVEEVAAMLGLSRSKTYAAVKAKKIPSIRIDGSVRIPRRALEAWLDEQTTGGAR
jgi:excisionase family DNA binding protein